MAEIEDIRRYISGAVEYAEADRRFPCRETGTWFYDDPFLLRKVALSPTERSDAVMGLWGISVCPEARKVALWGAFPPRLTLIIRSV